MPKCTVSFVVNGTPHNVETQPMRRLLDVLREDLHLTGTKEGCGEGECGACSVLLNGQLVNSCLLPVLEASSSVICTIEGVAANGMHPVQRAFAECGAAQCGICTPGMVLASIALLQTVARPTLEQIREALAGNLCRCTGYGRIFQAVQRAAQCHGSTSQANESLA